MTTTQEDQIAVFIDYENVALSFRGRYNDDIDWTRVMEPAIDLGRIAIRRSYADWGAFRNGQREMLGLGVDLIHVPSKRGKNAADIRIVIDVMEMMISSQHISHVLLVSGDGDFTELVHRLRANGKVVVGMGVSGASAEYLINACDQFIFYDKLVDAEVEKEEDGEDETAVGFDITEARQLLRRALKRYEGDWVSAGKIKSVMRGMNPAFSERNYDFSNFKSFLLAQNDIAKTNTADGGHFEVQMVASNNGNSSSSKGTKNLSPEAQLDRYLQILSKQKIRMTPSETRPQIILRFFHIVQATSGKTLNEYKDELHSYFEETAPHIKYQDVHEAVHQLFHTYCLEFDMEGEEYAEDVRLWDRKVTLAEGIKRPPDLLDNCDRGLLRRIRKRLGNKKINREVAARLLYGSVRGQKMLDHIKELIEEVENEKESA
ncbi:MAG: NYN domain-containing protein [Chloroflexota bacterium]